MSLQIDITVEPGWVKLTCRGEYSLTRFLDLVQRTYDATTEHGRPAALVDITDVTGTPTTLERFEIGEELARCGAAAIRVAAVGNLPLIDPSRFAAVVAKNRGANMWVFEDCDAAVRWLENRTEVSSPESAKF